MEFFRSPRGLEGGAVGFDAALEGRPALAEGGPPKKSSPSNESPCLGPGLACGGAVLVAGLLCGMSAVLGLEGGSEAMSPNKSTAGAAAARGGGGAPR